MDAQFEQFCDSVKEGKVEEVQRLYQQQFCHRKNEAGYTALMEAACEGHLPIVKYLVDEGADLELKDKWWGMTSLHLASTRDHPEVVSYLVESGADIAAVDKDGETALQVAQSFNQKTCTYILEAAADKLKICELCDTDFKDCMLECGYTLCMTCGDRLLMCPFCMGYPANPRQL